MKKSLMAFGAAAGLLAAACVGATDVGVSADVGTTGFGLHASLPLQTNLNARIGVNAASYNYSGSTSDADYDLKLKLNTYDALLDWFPAANGFRVSGGLVYNNNRIDTVAKPKSGASYTFNGNTYTAAQAGKINGSFDFRKTAPYLGIGWGNAVAQDKGWGFSSDLGVLFQGTPNSTLTNSGCSAPVNCAQLAADVAAEKIKLDDKISNFKFYPVVRFGVTYKF